MTKEDVKAVCKALKITAEERRLVIANLERVREMVDLGNPISVAVSYVAGACVDNSAFDCMIEENGKEILDPLPK